MGCGTFTLNGNASFSAGITHVYDSGKLIVNGSLGSAVTVDSGSHARRHRHGGSHHR